MFQWKVVGVATYTYFAACLIGRQYGGPTYNCTKKSDNGTLIPTNEILPDTGYMELFFPAQTILEFLFYMGLLKVCHMQIIYKLNNKPSYNEWIVKHLLPDQQTN